MTALQTYKEILSLLKIGIENPSVGSNDLTQRNVVQFMDRAGRDLVKRADWPDLIKPADLVSVSAVEHGRNISKFTLPSDFSSTVAGGGITDSSDYERVIPVVNDSSWTSILRHGSDYKYYIVSDGELKTNVPITSIHLQYVSLNWVSPNKQAVTADSDEFLVPSELIKYGAIWRWNRSKGFDYEDLLAEYEDNVQLYYRDARGVS